MTSLHIDFETRSTADLKKVGLDVYSKHPDTDVWCMAFAFDDEHVILNESLPAKPDGRLIPCGSDDMDRVFAHIRAGGIVVAHNAHFELAIWNNIMAPRHGWPVLRAEQTRCTMAQAYAMSLPGSLEKAAAAVGIKEQKDLAGGRLMLQMARPRTVDPLTWWDEPEKLAKLYEYCKQDVRVERELEKRLMQLSPTEQRVWQLDYRINQRGFHVDRPAIQAALQVARSEKDRLDVELRNVTGNFVGFSTENARLVQWIQNNGVGTESVAKAEILDLLSDDGLPPVVRKALTIRQEAGKTSMAKLDRVVEALSQDGRLRNTFAYHGAATGRWAGRRVQPHNFPRQKLKPDVIDGILFTLPAVPAARASAWLDNFYGAPLDVLPQCLRSMICAPAGRELLGADFSNIEGRVLAWLAGEEWKLEAFREQDAGTGPDIYLKTYAESFNCTIEEAIPHRQTGKTEDLAFGYQGGLGAWRTMEKVYRPPVFTDEQVHDIKNRWRGKHAAITRYWPALEEAAIRAVLSGGIIATGPAGRQVRFRTSGSFLWLQLPSGRVLCYPYPQIRQVETSWGELKDALTYMTVPNPDDRKKGKIIDDPSNRNDWCRTSTYGGKLAENVTQAVARDLLAEAMLRLDAAGGEVVLHVHDEVVIEVPQHKGSLGAFGQIVREVPGWAAGLPIAAKPWRAKRYGKYD